MMLHYGELVADAMDRVGAEGMITVEESKTTEIVLEVVEGMQFDRGYLSPYFITNAEKMHGGVRRTFILLHEKKLSSLQPMLSVLEAVVQSGKPLLLIAEDIEGDALAAPIVNKLRGGLRAAAVKSPGFGERRRAMLEDIAVLTGGQVVSDDLGLKLEGATLDMLGRAKRVGSTRRRPRSSAAADKSRGSTRASAQIKDEIAATASDYDKEKLGSGWRSFGRRRCYPGRERPWNPSSRRARMSSTMRSLDEGRRRGGDRPGRRPRFAALCSGAREPGEDAGKVTKRPVFRC